MTATLLVLAWHVLWAAVTTALVAGERRAKQRRIDELQRMLAAAEFELLLEREARRLAWKRCQRVAHEHGAAALTTAGGRKGPSA